jgi:hypothetical protein
MEALRVLDDADLRVCRVLFYFDRVSMFLGEWTDGRGAAIASLVDEEDEADLWFISPVSVAEVVDIGAGSLDFRAAFIGDGTKEALVLRERLDGTRDLRPVASRDLELDALPMAGVKMPSPLLDARHMPGVTDVRAIVKLTGAEKTTLAPHPRAVSQLIGEFVDLVVTASAKRLGLPLGKRGALTQTARSHIPMRMPGIAHASYGAVIEFGPDTPKAVGTVESWPEADAIVASLRALHGLLQARSALEEVSGIFGEYGPRFANHYRKILEVGMAANSGIGLEWRASGGGANSIEIEPQALPTVLQSVRKAYTDTVEGTFAGTGDLLGADFAKQHTFKLVPRSGELADAISDDEKALISGSLADNIQHMAVPLYGASVRVHRNAAIDEATGSERVRWTLLALEGGSKDPPDEVAEAEEQ